MNGNVERLSFATRSTLQSERGRTIDPLRRETARLGEAPFVSCLLLQWFTTYCRWYTARHFHSLRLARSGFVPGLNGGSLVLYCNHSSWWDPIVALLLRAVLFPERQLFAPMDAAALARYRVLRRLGFFGVEQNTVRGARQFLRSSESILRRSRSILAVTAQGRFADARERPVRLQPGLGHLACRMPSATFVPVAIEYAFWEERLPEILVRFGPGLQPEATGVAERAEDWTARFEAALQSTQDVLADEAQVRRPSDFSDLLRGGAGQGGVYDLWRAFAAWSRGERFVRQHGMK